MPAGERSNGADGDATVLRWWLLSRGLLIVLFAVEATARSDIGYYAYYLQQFTSGDATVQQTLREYPLPVLALLLPLWLLSGGNLVAFHVVFAAAMLAVDGAFAFLLWRAGGRRPSPATTLWLAGVPLLGPVALARFDLVPGVLAAAALLLLVRRPAWSGSAVAAGVALKLWPVLLVPAVTAWRPGRLRAAGGFAVTGAVVLAGSLLAGGTARLLSPLSFQGVRGLQIESLPALPLMVGWVFDKQRWRVFYGQANSNEVTGVGAEAMLTASTALTLATGVVLLVLWVRAWRRGAGPAAVAWVVLTTVALFLVTNKVFSPQYLLWLLPVVAATAVLSPGRTVNRIGMLTAAACGLTHLVYPLLYGTVVDPGPLNGLGVGLLVLRDAALIWLTYLALRAAWRATSLSADVDGAALGDARERADRQGLTAERGVDTGSP